MGTRKQQEPETVRADTPYYPQTDTLGEPARLLSVGEQRTLASVMRLTWALELAVDPGTGQFDGDFDWVNDLPPDVREAVAAVMGTAYDRLGAVWDQLENYVDRNVPGAYRTKNDIIGSDCYPG